MLMEENYNKLLLKWLNRELTLEEQELFERSEDYNYYKSIIDGISKLKVPGQQTEEEAYSDFQAKLQNNNTDYERLLVKWLNKELTVEEQELLERSEDYNYYKSIIDGISKLKVPGQQTEEEAYSDFQAKLQNNNTDHERLLVKWLNKELTAEEQELLERSEDYKSYKSIIDGISKLKVPGQQTEEEAYSDFQAKLQNNNTDYERLLVKWLNKELTAEEQELLERSEDYNYYKSIIDGISKLKVPGQQTEEEAYSDFQKKLHDSTISKGKVIHLNVLRYIGYAASVIFIVGLSLFFFGNTVIETSIAQQQNVTLPDNSLATVNALSKLTYNKYFFSFNRKLNLDGEVFFEVKKGSNFTVSTSNGDIHVLGTKFNVVSRDNFFETACFEGKVQVSTIDDNTILTAGNKVSFLDGIKKQEVFDKNSSDKKPTWTIGISNFKSTPLKHVINQLESQFPITIDYKGIEDKLSMLYTGSFPHNNLDNALENVFLTMGIEYSKDKDDSSLIILKNQKFNRN
ncbi:FecR family protein [Zobellia uliginosa]|uniref:FecR family protein n=2 Tax=Zobellia uliginosa TaxID=143224 RepID=A0ABY1L267_9FLAO|nr:FecR family protein [Zobellia uliginosa]